MTMVDGRQETFNAAAGRVADVLRQVMEAASTLRSEMPTFGEVEDALTDFANAKEALDQD